MKKNPQKNKKRLTNKRQQKCDVCKKNLKSKEEQLAGLCIYCKAEAESCGCSDE